jgi:hypothetical protein
VLYHYCDSLIAPALISFCVAGDFITFVISHSFHSSFNFCATNVVTAGLLNKYFPASPAPAYFNAPVTSHS